ncbi:MAG TPA: hypothetical protein VEA38_03610 [Terriglobales bacterium]|nr:hypothetical protein [Terriglobales bacterium]
MDTRRDAGGPYQLPPDPVMYPKTTSGAHIAAKTTEPPGRLQPDPFAGANLMLTFQELAQNWEAIARHFADHKKGCPRRDAAHDYTEACRCGHDAIFRPRAASASNASRNERSE